VPGLRRVAALGRRRLGSEHGAIAALLAVLLSGGVLIGMGAVVIDVGRLYVEREELQTGADAASWKIALSCAGNGSKTPTVCTNGQQEPVADVYAQKNAKDQRADAQVCINNTGCPNPWTTGVTCPPLPVPAAGNTVGNYVEVRTSTVTSSGATLLPPSFAQAMAGSTYTGKQVGACARVNWGPPAVTKALALGISLCDWKRMTNSNKVYYGPLGTTLSQIGVFNLIGLQNPGSGSDSAIPLVLPLTAFGLPVPSCLEPPPLGDLTEPRGYVWLNNADSSPPDSNCMINVKVGDYPPSFVLSGITIGLTCAAKLAAIKSNGTPVLVPIFDEIKPAVLSLTPQYHVVGFAPFVVTGYQTLLLGTLNAVGSALTGGTLFALLNSVLCGTGKCIYGYFSRTVVPSTNPQFGTGNDFGATIIGRTG
jgi:Flp pilus assembly protein TadG